MEDAAEISCEAVEINPSNPGHNEVAPVDDEKVVLPPVEEMSTETVDTSLPNECADVGVTSESAQEDKTVEISQESLANGDKLKEHEESTAKETTDNASAESQSQDEVENAINEQELKYWNAVKENPQDFTSWTYLLQFVEQENKLASARQAFDAFLKRYPFCYGYWKKFADMEKKNGDTFQAAEVFERGVEAIALSVDLWVHYLNFTSHSTKGQPDSATAMRSLFERAISAAGEEFRSDKLWDAYIEWEKSQRQLQRVTALYDRVLTVPTLNYTKHWSKFQEHINSNPLDEVLSAEELLKLKAEAGAAPPGFSFESEPDIAPPPGADNDITETSLPEGEADSKKTAEAEDPEVNAVRAKVIALRKVLYTANEAEVNKRWAFEDAIKRPYFHVKPLERVQLKNWREYLDFEITTGNHRRVVILFERCIIACALYEDFWLRFASYMEVHDCLEGCQHVYERACNVHLPSKPHIHLAWTAFEEKHGNVEKSREILANLDNVVPNLAYVKLRRANLERRCKQIVSACTIYETSISESKDKDLASFYSIKYARFLTKIAKDSSKSREVLKAALQNDQENKRLYLQLLDLELSVDDVSEEKVEEVFDLVKNSTLSEEIKEGFSQRRLEFLEDFSNSVVKITKAHEAHSKLYKSKASTLTGRKRLQDDGMETNSKVAKTDSSSDVTQTGSYPSTTDYSGSYAAGTAAAAVTSTYNYSNPQWLAGYQPGHAGYNYSNWYQQYGQTYQPAQ